MNGWWILAIGLVVAGGVICWILHNWRKSERELIRHQIESQKAEDHANETIQNMVDATRQRAGTEVEKLDHHQVIRDLEDKFGGPGKP